MNPKLRQLEIVPIQHRGQPMLLLRDPLRLADTSVAVPRQLAPLLVLMDGSRGEQALEAAALVRHGLRLAPGLLARLLHDLDASFLLDNSRFRTATSDALLAYRAAPSRPLAGLGDDCPADAGGASAWLQAMIDALPSGPVSSTAGAVRGLVSPHIDYHRGGPVYAEVWSRAAESAAQAELVILFGTDHSGSEASLTLTRQSYATPWGVLPTDLDLVDALAEAIGPDHAYAHELHHRREHSIELAAVWLHHVRGGRGVPVIPILCGSFAGFIAGEGDPAAHEPFSRALALLGRAMAARRSLVVAAADLAHVGPAFGDPYGLDPIGRAQVQQADQRLLSAVCAGDAQAFFDRLKAERDRRHVCGLPPIYLTLRLLAGACGEPAGYALCPADPEAISYVSIAGVLLR